MTAPSKAVNDRSKKAGQTGERRRARRRPGPVTIAIAGAITLVTIALMVFALLFVWQSSNVDRSPGEGAQPSSHYAAGLKIEANGAARKDASGQWIVPLKATNDVMMPHRVEGTPPVETPVPAPVTVKAATVKVLLYGTTEDKPDRHLLGTGYGGFSAPEGLAPGASTTFEVPIAGFDEANVTDYEGRADLVSTDQDPPSGATDEQPAAATPSIIPLATTTRGTTSP